MRVLSRQDQSEVEGVVVESFQKAMFRVDLENELYPDSSQR